MTGPKLCLKYSFLTLGMTTHLWHLWAVLCSPPTPAHHVSVTGDVHHEPDASLVACSECATWLLYTGQLLNLNKISNSVKFNQATHNISSFLDDGTMQKHLSWTIWDENVFLLLCLKNGSGGYIIIMAKAKHILHRYVMTGERE